MLKSGYKLLTLSLVAALVWPAGGVASGAGSHPPQANGPQAPSAFTWYDGLIQYSTITNCASIIFGSPYEEYGVGTYVGFYADPNAGQPAPNSTYYVHVLIYGLGNSCSGMRAYIDLALPANTALAITGGTPVKCYYDGTPFGAPDCPQSLPASGFDLGAFDIPSTDAAHAHTWPIPQGHNLEIQVPVKSTASLTNSPLQANVHMADGNSNPTLRPTEGVYVFSGGGGSSATTILYPSPSTLTITASTGHSQAYLYTNLGGTGYFNLGTTTNYEVISESVSIPAGGPAWLVFDNWGPPPLQPNTLYHWRFMFHDSNGHDTFGTDQTFQTLSDGQVILGNGTPADCTALNFESALPTAKSIDFNCGALPITLTLASGHAITHNLTIDGGNKIILDGGGANRQFDVQAGAALTLTGLTLAQGFGGCGGAVQVNAGARLAATQMRFFDNNASGQGGALCIQTGGSAAITDSNFARNQAGGHGGAIGNYGALTITGTKLISNVSALNGGAIDTTGFAAITGTTFLSNTSGWRGGGINTFTGLLKVVNTSFISNKTLGFYGGGLANDSNGTDVSGALFFGNETAGWGGALESSGSLTVTNSTLSGNHADLLGGGVYWAGSGPITVSLLNDTVVSNTTGGQGGNFYVGGSPGISVTLRNSLVAFGSPNNCDSALASQGHNLENTNACGFSGVGDLHNTNPKIGPLRDNGGPSWTHALLLGSPAIDAGANSGCPAADQRGRPRPRDGDGNGSSLCDMGAFESQPGEALMKLFLPLVKR